MSGIWEFPSLGFSLDYVFKVFYGVGWLLNIAQHFNIYAAGWEISLSSMSSTNAESPGSLLLTGYSFALEPTKGVTTKIDGLGIYFFDNAHPY